MRLTSKGQVTIPMEIGDHVGLRPGSEVEFAVDGDTVLITKAKEQPGRGRGIAARLRGRGDVAMTTDEIMALTRDG